MKNIVLAAVSVVALTAVSGANAQNQPQTPSSETLPTMQHTPPTSASADSKMMKLQPPAAPSAPMMKHHAAPHKATAAHHKHHAKKAHHHKHHAGSAYHPADVGGVYITLPPMNPELYWGRTDCPYLYHGGYFWYPHTRMDLLANYTPYGMGGRYWYPSHMHPHMVYINRTPLVYTYPYPMGVPHPMDGAMYGAQPAPMLPKAMLDVRPAEQD